MAKKKISSQDFLNLLEDQETSADKRAFAPEKTSPGISKRQPANKLDPVKKELLDLALKKAPKFLTDLAKRLRG